MLIVITAENLIVNECRQLNAMFAAGLQILHLRKPGYTEKQYTKLLMGIETHYHQRIVLHDHHRLCKKVKVKGIHVKEAFRKQLGDRLYDYLQNYKKDGFTVSSSFHDVETLKSRVPFFDYVMLSPVFDSISKEGYHGKGFMVEGIKDNIIALGGVTGDKLKSLLEMGYSGAAVLGAVWKANNPQEAFSDIMKAQNVLNR
ncbi:thiamine phosphate synthase [Zhouia spongiae]|uniref:Thiamine phosphate synthase n=1 Tax=Zhouia spongiae TaxID=2202721 RepID=A0ABY3YQZ4_9FLAO|nr:thiamine phosphate synthase [Zhouia spongiae]UNY99921.1 thiamine phosphate synthase [Zhouia spongiae]